MPYYVRFKKGVKFDPIAPAAATILAAIWSAAQTMQRDLLVTCGSESHKPPSRHVLGEAVDLGVGGMDGRQVVTLWRTLCNSLGVPFYVSIEAKEMPDDDALKPYVTINKEATALHIHIQPDKGTTYPPA